MPRVARKKSKTGIYHAMMRGNNKQIIFRGVGDKAYFMKLLSECKEKMGFELYAYCLMPNHVHLLIKENDTPIDLIFRSIESRYASWFNRKYERVGHLFQDRFKSETVENEQYFLTVLRYIIQNPLKAKLANKLENCEWNSYREYYDNKTSIVDTRFAVDLIGSREILIDYLHKESNESVMEVLDSKQITTLGEALEMMKNVSNCSTREEFKLIDRGQQKKYIREMLGEGLSMGMISTLTGLSKATVSRAK